MPLHGIDKALLWLRLEAKRQQGEVAKAAKMTPAMLCAYEKGKRPPSLQSLQRILDALGVDAHGLAVALDSVNHRAPAAVAPSEKNEPQRETSASLPIRAVLAPSRELPPQLEELLQALLDNFASSLRQVSDALSTLIEKDEQRDSHPAKKTPKEKRVTPQEIP
jgi:transcriptional regulator with XRE-family HTH domain